jgi:hypothetical protein
MCVDVLIWNIISGTHDDESECLPGSNGTSPPRSASRASDARDGAARSLEHDEIQLQRDRSRKVSSGRWNRSVVVADLAIF